MEGSTTTAFGMTMSATATTATTPPNADPNRRACNAIGPACDNSTTPVAALMAAISTTDRGEVRTGIRTNGTTKVPHNAPIVLAPSRSPVLVPTRSSESATSIELIGKTTPITSAGGATTITSSLRKLKLTRYLVSTPSPARTT